MKVLWAFIKKEFYQIIRDPSSFMIAFVLPLLTLFIYMYGVNLDTVKVKLGFKMDDSAEQVRNLASSFDKNNFITLKVYDDKNKMYDDISNSKIHGFVTVPNDFSKKLDKNMVANLQLVADGSETNLANYVQSYSVGIANLWLNSSKYADKIKQPLISVQPRYWYNQSIDSHYFIVPGSLSITMTLIGMLLTALVVAREWERGTMEAILTTKIKKWQFIIGKYIPYFGLGMLSMLFNVFLIVYVFNIPFRGNYLVLMMFSALFLICAMGQGLLVSTILKNQFTASQAALVLGFLPGLMLSGLTFPISSMPLPLQYLSMAFPARYFVECIQSEFMAGTVWEVLIPNCMFMITLGLLLFLLVYKKTKLRLD